MFTSHLYITAFCLFLHTQFTAVCILHAHALYFSVFSFFPVFSCYPDFSSPQGISICLDD